jgi:hypothetical protein
VLCGWSGVAVLCGWSGVAVLCGWSGMVALAAAAADALGYSWLPPYPQLLQPPQPFWRIALRLLPTLGPGLIGPASLAPNETPCPSPSSSFASPRLGPRTPT